MGWLYRNEPLHHETPVEFVVRHFSHDGATTQSTVVAAAAIRGTIYAAIRNADKQTGTTYVFCAVVLFRNSKRHGFGYKDMTECMGPCEVDCPDRIMRLLSPVSDIPNPSYAADWRARVAAAKARRAAAAHMLDTLAPGDVIKLQHRVQFIRSGISADRFVFVEHRKRTPIFSPVGHLGFMCRLGRDLLSSAQRCVPEATPAIREAEAQVPVTSKRQSRAPSTSVRS